jgi:hypothetical protein
MSRSYAFADTGGASPAGVYLSVLRRGRDPRLVPLSGTAGQDRTFGDTTRFRSADHASKRAVGDCGDLVGVNGRGEGASTKFKARHERHTEAVVWAPRRQDLSLR